MAAFLMATDKRGISSVGLADRLDISQKKAWYMLHKLRRAMGERDGGYLLDGLVELMEGFFGPPKDGGSRGRTKARSRVLAGLDETLSWLLEENNPSPGTGSSRPRSRRPSAPA